jgi:protein gp37
MGCAPVHTGCLNCYAKRQTARLGVKWGADGTRRKTSEAYWRKPLKWDREAACDLKSLQRFPADSKEALRLFGAVTPTWPADLVTSTGVTFLQAQASIDRLAKAGYIEPNQGNLGGYIRTMKGWRPPRIFPSLCDVFEDWDGPVMDATGEQLFGCAAVRCDFFRLIDQTRNLDWLLLTKRPENIQRMMMPWLCDRMGAGSESPDDAWKQGLPIQNLWLLYSASNQETLEDGWDSLVCASLFVPTWGVSLEPLVEPIDLNQCWRNGPLPSWVIVGFESGPKRRPGEIEWLWDIYHQCEAAGVPLFVKQDNGPKPGMQGRIPDKLWAVKQFPAASGGDV